MAIIERPWESIASPLDRAYRYSHNKYLQEGYLEHFSAVYPPCIVDESKAVFSGFSSNETWETTSGFFAKVPKVILLPIYSMDRTGYLCDDLRCFFSGE